MGERILVADGNPASAEILSRYLVEQGAETVVCKNGRECLAEVGQGDVSMIFLEAVMPDISGLEVLTSIRQQYDPIELPVIIVTERREDNLPARLIDMGANDFLHKPVNCLVAIPRIRQQIIAFKLHRQRRQNQRSEFLNALLATYNHELHETLADAMAEVRFARLQHDSPSLRRVAGALRQISLIAGRINEFGPGDIDETGYLLGGKVLRLTKVEKV